MDSKIIIEILKIQSLNINNNAKNFSDTMSERNYHP